MESADVLDAASALAERVVPQGEPCCSLTSCTTRGVKKLMRCSRCQIARYYSRECQLSHFPQHKGECKQLNSDRLKVELEKSEKKEAKSLTKSFESISQTQQMLCSVELGRLPLLQV
jgi:hypothetical protein